MGKPKNTVRAGINLDKDVYARLKAYSEMSMIPMSRIVNRAIDEYFDKNEKKEPNRAD